MKNTENENNKKDLNKFLIYFSIAFCFILFCSIPVIFGVFPLEELPLSFIGAVMGAVMGAVITVLITSFLLNRQSAAQEKLLEKQSEAQERLLERQSATEEKKENHIKIFEKKSKTCEEYINLVWKIWEGRKITSEQYQELTSFYYKNLMIYLTETNSKIIGDTRRLFGKP